MPTTIIAILEVGTPSISFITEINGELWTMDPWAVFSLLTNTGVSIIHIMFGTIQSANIGVRTGKQIQHVCSAAIMIPIVGRRIMMPGWRAVADGLPIMKNAPPRIVREFK